MIKMTSSLIVLGVAGALSLAAAAPTLAKTNAKAGSHRAKTPTYQYNVRRPVPVAPIVRCLHGGTPTACDATARTAVTRLRSSGLRLLRVAAAVGMGEYRPKLGLSSSAL